MLHFKINKSEKYPFHELRIKKWLAEHHEFANRVNSPLQIINETDKALLIKFESGVQEEHWIPKSQCEISKRKETELF